MFVDRSSLALFSVLSTLYPPVEILVQNARQATSNIAHDLRTPLARLREYLAAAERAAPGAPVLAGALARTDEIIKIFSAMLQIAEVEAGAVRGRFTRIDLTLLCQNLAEDRDQAFCADIEPGLAAVQGDAALLTQALVNGIENALRHCPRGTLVRLKAGRHGDEVEISIIDRGSGIPETQRELVFQHFVRLDSARAGPGNGLGLALIRAVAALHQGEAVLLDNDPGLVLRLRMPAAS